jgi:hypothetical protein
MHPVATNQPPCACPPCWDGYVSTRRKTEDFDD